MGGERPTRPALLAGEIQSKTRGIWGGKEFLRRVGGGVKELEVDIAFLHLGGKS